MKFTAKTVILVIGAVAACAALLFGAALPLLDRQEPATALHMETPAPVQGQVGQPLQLTVHGTGLAGDTGFSLQLDSGNQQAIRHRLETFGAVETMVLDDTTLYLGLRNKKIHKVDVSDPLRPKLAETLRFVESIPTAMAHGDRTLWVGTGGGSLDSVRPNVPLSRIQQGQPFLSLAPGPDNLLYAAQGKKGLVIFRHPPTSDVPIELGTLSLSSAALSVAVNPPLAYVGTSKSGLAVCDVSDPEQPKLLATIPVPGIPTNLAARGSWLYARSSRGFTVFDLSDPRQPRQAAHLAGSGGNYQLALHDDLALLTTGAAGLLAINIADPRHPYPAGHLTTEASIRSVVARGRLAYLGTADNNLLTIDLDQIGTHPDWRPRRSFQARTDSPSSPYPPPSDELLESVFEELQQRLPQNCDINALTLVDEVVYAGSDCGLIVAPRNAPEELRLFQEPQSHVRQMLITPGRAYIAGAEALAANSGHIGPNLAIYDLTNPLTPRLLATVATPDAIINLKISGDLVYLAIQDQGVMILDIGTPAAPKKLGKATLNWPESAFATYKDIEVVDHLLYVATGRAGLQVFDVSDPLVPQRIAAHNSGPGLTNALFRHDNLLLAIKNNDETKVFDISHPTQPQVVFALESITNPRQVQKRDNRMLFWLSNSMLIKKALPLFAEKLEQTGRAQTQLHFPPPPFAGDYFLYAFDDSGRRKIPGVIRIAEAQK